MAPSSRRGSRAAATTFSWRSGATPPSATPALSSSTQVRAGAHPGLIARLFQLLGTSGRGSGCCKKLLPGGILVFCHPQSRGWRKGGNPSRPKQWEVKRNGVRKEKWCSECPKFVHQDPTEPRRTQDFRIQICDGQWGLISLWNRELVLWKKNKSHLFVPYSPGSPGAAAVDRKPWVYLIFHAEKQNQDLWVLQFPVSPSTPSPKSESP